MVLSASLPAGFTDLYPEQAVAIEQAVEAFRMGARLVVLDAPPGIGKTLIGEMVRRELKVQSAIYLCTDRALQDQFASSFPHAAVLKGRSNYPTQRYPERFERGRTFDRLTAADCTYTKERGSCDWCHLKSQCPYEMAKDRALREPLVCGNTAYFIAEANGPGRFSGFPLVVLDECDLLENEILRATQVQLTNRQLQWLGIGWPQKKTVESAWADWLGRSIPKVEYMYEAYRESDDPDIIKQQKRIENILGRMKMALDGVRASEWVYDGYQQGRVEFIPIEVGDLGDKVFWKHGQKFLCMSASVANGRAWVDEVGWKEGGVEVVECDSPFDLWRRAIRICPVAEMRHGDDEAVREMARGVRAVMDMHPDGRILVHTNSYALASDLETELASTRVITYLDSMDRMMAEANFHETPASVLLAPSMGRGYDGAGDKCRVVVVAKLPYPGLGSKRVSARLYGSGRRGGVWYTQQTARELMQMSGRGTRSREDWSVCYILDGMFPKFYKENKSYLSRWWTKALVWGGSWRHELERRIEEQKQLRVV